MKGLLTCAMLAMFGAGLYGCDSMGTNDADTKHETVKEKTVTDSNGNVVEHSETKAKTENNQ